MRCCVSYCKNSLKMNSKSPIITLHKFPTDQYNYDAWMKSLGIEKGHLPANPMVCSQHFKNVDFYTKDGLRKLRRGAIPSALQMCIICLATNQKLYLMSEYNLIESYESVTGISLRDGVDFPRKVCAECAQRLVACKKFRDKSIRIHTLLLQLIKKHGLVSHVNIYFMRNLYI